MQVTNETTTKPTQSVTPVEAQPVLKTTIPTQDTFVSSAKNASSGSTSLLGKISGAITGGLSSAGDALAGAFDWATSGLKSLLNLITRNGIDQANATFKAAEKADEARHEAAKKEDETVEAAAEASRQAAAQAASKH
ncbi:MAG TPA: hypothetical protein V6D47_22500 [Oscillatoriaceae cyanobacterium]